MNTITKEIALLNSLYSRLYYVKKEKDFAEILKEELNEHENKLILSFADEKIKELFKEPFSMNEIKTALKKANEAFSEICERNESDMRKILEKFKKSDFLKDFFFSEENMFTLKFDNECAYIEEFEESVLRKITFEASEVHINDELIETEVEVWFDTVKIVEENDSYILSFTDYFSDKIYEIRFSNISVVLKAYSADSDPLFWLFVNTPWEYLQSLANGINAHYTFGVATEKENKLFGLIKHLLHESFIEEKNVPAELYHVIEKNNLNKVIKPPYDLSKPYLCKKKFEPFWRELFNMILESQKDLPSYFDEHVSEEDFEKHKKLITKQMNNYGYVGTYPDYYKKDSLKKPVLYKTYNVSHTAIFEKNVEHHIHCYSFLRDGVIHTSFFVGTVFNKNEEKTDIYSTMFDCNGKAVFTILSTINAGVMDLETYELRTKKAVKAAVTRSELKKADKDDYFFKSIFDRNSKLNFIALLIASLFFSFGFSLIVPILLVVLEGNSLIEAFDFMKDNPILLIISVVGGLAATVFIAVAERISDRK